MDRDEIRNKAFEEAAGIILNLSKGRPHGLLRLALKQILERKRSPKLIHLEVTRVEETNGQGTNSQ